MNTHQLMQWLAFGVFCSLSAVLMACTAGTGGGGNADTSAGTRIIATSNIAADWIQQVAGDKFSVKSLIPRASDPHAYTPGPRDVAAVADADLVFTIGLDFEQAWLKKLLKSASVDSSRMVILGDYVKTIPASGGLHHDDGEGEEESHQQTAADPHFWLDPREVKRVLPVIVDRLAARTPAAREALIRNANSFERQLDELHAWITQAATAVPAERRLLVAAHESLGYFGSAYGFQIVGSVIPGVSTTREPSATELAKLVGDIKRLRAPAIFGETILDARMAKRISEEAGVRLITGLHTDSLGQPGSATGSYLSMMRTTASTIFDALR
ncbi:MAG: zinc ABC transporter substrate-binding protein [Dehalococcoidia bacterium]|nr:zinc ABC transporter substrate-binding protein [Dehalococcoidia bacterium]